MKEFIVPIADEGNISFVNNDLKLQELVRCDDCGYSFCEGFVRERLYCEKHPELGEIKGDWFCADCWKA